jgi:hypothetical protein
MHLEAAWAGGLLNDISNEIKSAKRYLPLLHSHFDEAILNWRELSVASKAA